MNEQKVAVISAFWYTGISVVLAAGFYLLTGGGKYDAIARYGGAVWVFMLAMIITMPVVIPRIKNKYKQAGSNG